MKINCWYVGMGENTRRKSVQLTCLTDPRQSYTLEVQVVFWVGEVPFHERYWNSWIQKMQKRKTSPWHSKAWNSDFWVHWKRNTHELRKALKCSCATCLWFGYIHIASCGHSDQCGLPAVFSKVFAYSKGFSALHCISFISNMFVFKKD